MLLSASVLLFLAGEDTEEMLLVHVINDNVAVYNLLKYSSVIIATVYIKKQDIIFCTSLLMVAFTTWFFILFFVHFFYFLH